MFEKIVNAVEPFGLTMVVIAGLVLSNRMQVSNRDIVGYATIFIGVALIIVHITKQMRTPKPATTKRKD